MAPTEPDTVERLNNFVIYLADPGSPGRICTQFTAPLLHRDAEDIDANEIRHVTNLSFDRLRHIIGVRTDEAMPLEDDDDLWAAISFGCRMGIGHITLLPLAPTLRFPLPDGSMASSSTAASSSAHQGTSSANVDDDLPSEDENAPANPAFDDLENNDSGGATGLSKDDALDLEDRSVIGQATKECLAAFQKFFGHAGEDGWLSGDRQNHRCVRLKHPRKPLYQHQASAVFWVAERLFSDGASGCVLGDEMGMGKTAESVALWVLHYLLREANETVKKARLNKSQAHLPADCPGVDATCPWKGSNSWGFQCPCEPGSLTARFARNTSSRPWLFLVPAGIMKKIERELNNWVDGSVLKRYRGFTYAENKGMIFKNNVEDVLQKFQGHRSLARCAVLSSYQSFKTSVKRPLENAGLFTDDYQKF